MTKPLYHPSDAARFAQDQRDLGNLKRRPTLPWRTLNVVIDGRGSAITAGVKGDAGIDFACRIKGWQLVADVAGELTLDVWRTNFAGFPPTVADSITGAAPPELGGAVKASDDALVGWDAVVSGGDLFRFNVASADGIVERVALILKLEAV